MKTVITFVAIRSFTNISEFKQLLKDSGATNLFIDELSADLAYDIYCNNIEHADAIRAIESLAKRYEVDFYVSHNFNRRKKLLIADMDSTIINIETIDEISAFAGVEPEVRKITEMAMNGDIGFNEAFIQRVALLANVPLSVFKYVYNDKLSINLGARELVTTMKASGAYTILASGGLTYFTNKIAHELGFESNIGNQVSVVDDKLTGEVLYPILDRDSKIQIMQFHLARLGLDLADALAVGDGSNDVAMVAAAGLGVAYKAKPVLMQHANAQINHTNLTTLLYFQGYKAEEIF